MGRARCARTGEVPALGRCPPWAGDHRVARPRRIARPVERRGRSSAAAGGEEGGRGCRSWPATGAVDEAAHESSGVSSPHPPPDRRRWLCEQLPVLRGARSRGRGRVSVRIAFACGSVRVVSRGTCAHGITQAGSRRPLRRGARVALSARGAGRRAQGVRGAFVGLGRANGPGIAAHRRRRPRRWAGGPGIAAHRRRPPRRWAMSVRCVSGGRRAKAVPEGPVPRMFHVQHAQRSCPPWIGR